MTATELPLFTWCRPECEVRPFPLAKRLGKVRDVASKLATKRTTTHIKQYRDQVETALSHHMAKLGVGAEYHPAEILAFWRAVHLEMARTSGQSRPEGSAA